MEELVRKLEISNGSKADPNLPDHSCEVCYATFNEALMIGCRDSQNEEKGINANYSN